MSYWIQDAVVWQDDNDTLVFGGPVSSGERDALDAGQLRAGDHLRSAAVLGLFGFPTLGLYIRQSFASTSYGEVWTYLYALLGLVLAFEAWSGALRRRLQA